MEQRESDKPSDPQTVQAFHLLERGQLLFERYRLTRVLGGGGMGVVWHAQDERLEREVALKVLPEHLRLDASALLDLKREAQRSLELTHPNIVRIHDFVEDGKLGAISMEFIDGDTLAALRMQQLRKVFEPVDLMTWFKQLCHALEYAHREAGLVHHDLKPSNVMVNRQGRVKVADFGIARSWHELTMRTTGRGARGTLLFMSPQQLTGGSPSVADDIYALGATLFDLLTGRPPFYAGDVHEQILRQSPPPVSERRREFGLDVAAIPIGWDEVIASCLAKEANARPHSAPAVAEQLEQGLATGCETRPIPQHPIAGVEFSAGEQLSATANSTESGRRAWSAYSWAAAATLLMIAGGWWLWSQRTPGPSRIHESSARGVDQTISSNALPDRAAITNSLSSMRAYLDRVGLAGTLTREEHGEFQLDLNGTRTSDLTPLSGIPFRTLKLNGTAIVDLGPLQDMPLTSLNVDRTGITNLAPLRGMPLTYLSMTHLTVHDLSPLAGMPLHTLNFSNSKVGDLRPLRGLPLGFLDLANTPVTDFTPLNGLPLHTLYAGLTKVRNLDFVRGMPLRVLGVNRTSILNLNPLRNLPLIELYLHECPDGLDLSPIADCKTLERLTIPARARNVDVLRSLPRLKSLNTIHDGWRQTASEFWAQRDAQK